MEMMIAVMTIIMCKYTHKGRLLLFFNNIRLVAALGGRIQFEASSYHSRMREASRKLEGAILHQKMSQNEKQKLKELTE